MSAAYPSQQYPVVGGDGYHVGVGVIGGIGIGSAGYIPQQQQAPPLSSPHDEQGQQSMTIDEMRVLHRSALAEADAKRTELRLVLASRYRELVGSSDEVIHMKERAEELDGLVSALPRLAGKVAGSAEALEDGTTVGEEYKKIFANESQSTVEEDDGDNESSPQDRYDSSGGSGLTAVRREISRLPRVIHRCLDENDVHGAAAALIALFDIVVSRSKSFPLASALSSVGEGMLTMPSNPPVLETQMKMVCLHVQTLPMRTVKLARKVLLRPAARVSGAAMGGAHAAAAALSALDLLDVDQGKGNSIPSGSDSVAPLVDSPRASKLIDLYYDSKAQLLNKLLNRLTLPSSISAADATSVTNAAEIILSRIVSILQYDVILYPFQIFVLRRFPVHDNDSSSIGSSKTNEEDQWGGSKSGRRAETVIEDVMSTLPRFDPDLLKSKASRFLAAHLPLIRTKVKSVLMVIAGTTASKLGQIRQTLYDKTDGAECMVVLDSTGVCSWDVAVNGIVDVRVVSHGTTFTAQALGSSTSKQGSGIGDEMNGHNQQGLATTTTVAMTTTSTARRFSLWGALFSNTFSSLVHSLLTTSFHSVHVRVVSTLRTSLARAPPFEHMLPHEAHRNALCIATELDASLRRVSDDAHELLVHAEEREESERRLRQSLYVQTCEIMGRLLNELRRMLSSGSGDRKGNAEEATEDATKVLIVGRLCHLLKFQLRSLPTLLDPKSSPAALATGIAGGGKGGAMITLMELGGSFDLADDDDDGLISFDEAMEAMESAFSGTQFRGAEMVRDTLLLSHPTGGVGAAGGASVGVASPPPPVADSRGLAPRNVTLSELALLSARGLRHDTSGHESALGTVQSSLDDIVRRCFQKWARVALSPPLKSFATTLQEHIQVASTVSDLEWKRMNGLIDKDNEVLLKEISDAKVVDSKLSKQSQTIVSEVSPHVVSYLLAVAGVLNRSVCPADSLPPVPSLEYAERLGISPSENKEIPNMMVMIRGSLLGEALTSVSHSLKEEIISKSDDCNNGDHAILKQCSPSSLVQLSLDVNFIQWCFFEINQHGFFLLESNSIDDSRGIMDGLSCRLSTSVGHALNDEASVTNAVSKEHARAFSSCDLFLSSLFGENDRQKFFSGAVNGAGESSESFVLDPLLSSRRFILLPIQAEKSLTELQLKGRYGKGRGQEEKGGGKDVSSGNTLGTSFGFLSSMLNKTR